MLKVRIVAVGKLKEQYWADAVEEYRKRLGKYVDPELIEVPDCADDAAAPEREGKAILPKLKGRVILADIGGKPYTSAAFADYLDRLTLTTGTVTFVVGGSRGVSEEIRQAADDKISFSPMTFPHQLFRVMLLEQLYRACTIRAGTQYHK